MELVIKIPDEEFEIDINDKFQDFFSRLRVEIKQHLITNTNLVCGAYELETIDMFLKAFNDSVQIPKGHGNLKDYDDLISRLEEYGRKNVKYQLPYLPTIIFADKEVNADSKGEN
jgi:hypothetical protein